MRNISSIGLLVALGSRAATGLSYVIDGTCGTAMDPVIAETIQMATKALDKLGSGDEVMTAALSQIFKTTDASFLTNGLKSIKGLTPAVDFGLSDIRIYCDNDNWDATPGGTSARWQLYPDAEKPSKRNRGKAQFKLNSEKDFEDQRYWDPKNELYRRTGSKGCQELDDIGEMGTFAQTYSVMPKAVIDSSQNPDRVTITICNKGLEEQFKVLSDVSIGKDLTADNFEMWEMEDLLSVTLFHEFCHMANVFAAPGSDGDEPNGWDDIMALSADSAKKAADAYAFLGLAAILSERNVRLSTDAEKSGKGILQHITKPEAPKKKRGYPVWFFS